MMKLDIPLDPKSDEFGVLRLLAEHAIYTFDDIIERDGEFFIISCGVSQAVVCADVLCKFGSAA